MDATATMDTKWNMREWLRRVFRRRSSQTVRVIQPTTPPVPDPPSPNSNLTKLEKEMILKAMRNQGSWYKCRLDHPYLVSACGIPTQLAFCPTCGETIGGMGQKSSTAKGNRCVKTAF